MSKLYFKYGVMGSSKSAQALMCKFNYEQQGFKVLLLKPQTDTRDISGGKIIVRSRIGLTSECMTFDDETNLYDLTKNETNLDSNAIIIVDECQFMTKEQVNELKEVSRHIPVLCYGLLTNFKTELFEGSKRLVEIADSLTEIKSVCACGKKAQVNARMINGKPTMSGAEIVLGGDESYKAMCYNCFSKAIKEDKNEKETTTP